MLEKLQSGILQVLTDSGMHFVRPSFWERVRLVWIFRNFSDLPQQVLSVRDQQLLSYLCEAQRMFRCGARELQNACVIGTLIWSVMPQSRRGSERRTHSRNPAKFEVRYGVPGGRLFGGQGRDFSGGGMSFSGAKAYPAGTELELRYRFEGNSEWIFLRALVRHCDGEHMGVQFLTFLKLDAPKILPVPETRKAPANPINCDEALGIAAFCSDSVTRNETP